MTAPLILLVDSDVSATPALEDAGYRVMQASTAEEAIRHVDEAWLVLTELDLPDEDGVTFVSDVRERSNVPIMVCSARSARDRMLSLKFGADMAVEKPIACAELVARVRAVFRRCYPAKAQPKQSVCGALTIDHAGASVRFAGKRVSITPTEFRLLADLAESCAEVVPYEDLIRHVWQQPSDPSLHHLLGVNVHRLRNRLRLAGVENTITAIHGVGYCLTSSTDFERRD